MKGGRASRGKIRVGGTRAWIAGTGTKRQHREGHQGQLNRINKGMDSGRLDMGIRYG